MLQFAFIFTLFAQLSMDGLSAAAISIEPIVTCQNLDLNGVVQQVCATYIFETPLPVQNSYGITDYVGRYCYIFDFWEGLENGTDTIGIDVEQAATASRVTISWEPEERICEVLISGEACLLCVLCDETEDPADTTVSADCTNLSVGRAMECERAFIFYPFVAHTTTADPSVVRGEKSGGYGEKESAESATCLIGFLSSFWLMLAAVWFLV